MRIATIASIAACMMLGLFLTSPAQALLNQQQIGDMIEAWPDVQFRSTNGTVKKVDQFKGKVLFVNTWANWCVNCVAEMASIKRLQDMVGPENMEVILVSTPKDWDKDREFAAAKGFPFPLYVLTNTPMPILNKALGVVGQGFTLPITTVYDRQGAMCFPAIGGFDWMSQQMVDKVKRCLQR